MKYERETLLVMAIGFAAVCWAAAILAIVRLAALASR